MNFFDHGFSETKAWLSHAEGSKPCPPAWTTDDQRIEWWRGADKAQEFHDIVSAQEDAEDAAIEYAAIIAFYVTTSLLGLWLTFVSPYTAVIGVPLALYSSYRMGRVSRKTK